MGGTLKIKFIYIILLLSISQISAPDFERTIEPYESLATIDSTSSENREIQLQLEERLSIGNPEDDRYSFYGNPVLALGPAGEIIVLDTRNHNVRLFANDGQFLRTIGQKGQGPGEFEMPSRIFAKEDGTFCVSQRSKVQYFDLEGKYLGSTPLRTNISVLKIDRNDNIVGIFGSRTGAEMNYELVIIGRDGAEKDRVSLQTVKNPFTNFKGALLGAMNPFVFREYFISLDENRIVYGNSEEYKLFVLDESFKTSLTIQRQIDPDPYSNKERSAILKDEISFNNLNSVEEAVKAAFQFPGRKAFFYNMVADDIGRLYVERKAYLRGEDGDLIFDLFDRAGRFARQIRIGKEMKMSSLRMIFIDKFVYAVVPEGQSGYQCIKKYLIKNWDEIQP